MRMPHDPVQVLPPELISACFRWLNLNGRIAVSHVSRSWRNAALSDLWHSCDYTVPDEPYRINALAGLRAMLLRSDPVPFRLTCFADLSDALVALLVQNMHRMQVLHLISVRRSTIIHLMTQNAPVLESFSYSWSPEPNIPTTLAWSDVRAPRLRSVRLGKFLLPGIDAFSAMGSFGATVPNACRLSQPLASVFPALTSIQLHNITQAALDSLLPLPPTLTSVTFTSSRTEPIDYADFLEGCTPATISHLDIHWATATSVSPAVDQFTRAADGPWELQLGINNDITLRAVADIGYRISCDVKIHHLVLHPALTDALLRVAILSLSSQKYVTLYRSAAWDRSLPALSRLELAMIIGRGAALPIRAFCNPDVPLDAPALEGISIKIRAGALDAVRALPFVAQVVRSLACPRLAHLALFVDYPDYLINAELIPIEGLAPRISIGDLDGNGSVTVRSTYHDS